MDRLIIRLAEGDRSAFTPAFQAIWPHLHALCLSLLRHPEDADDAAQQAMEKVLTRASDYDRSRPALPWALAIAAWECRTILKKVQRRREVTAQEIDDLEGIHFVEDEVIRRQLELAALDSLRELSEADRGTLIATYWEDAQGAASPALRKRRQRALDRLRTAFRRLYEPR